MEINLKDYTQEEKESIINSYGYTYGKTKQGLTNIYELYGAEEATWIIAECIFEQS